MNRSCRRSAPFVQQGRDVLTTATATAIPCARRMDRFLTGQTIWSLRHSLTVSGLAPPYR